MPLMYGLRKLFKRSTPASQKSREPVEIDLTGDGSEDEPMQDGKAARDNGDGPLATVRRRKPSLTELQHGYDEVMGLVRKIGDHLDAQTQRTERLVELMERLPEAIDSLPEMHRQNTRLLDVLNEHLAHGRDRDDSLNATLGKLSESSGHQTEVLGLLQQQFDAGTRSSQQMAQTLGSFSEALGDLSQNNQRSTEILSNLMRSAEQRESRVVEMMGRTQKWIIGLLITIGILAIAAIVVAAIAMLR